jgi:hypothetical protein
MYPPSLQDLVEKKEITLDDALLAIMPRPSVADANLERRAFVLTRARIYFLERLIEDTGPGVGLHILKDDDWRL